MTNMMLALSFGYHISFRDEGGIILISGENVLICLKI